MSNPSKDNVNCIPNKLRLKNLPLPDILDMGDPKKLIAISLARIEDRNNLLPSLPDILPNEIVMDIELYLENLPVIDMDDPYMQQLHTMEDLGEPPDNHSESHEVDWHPFPFEDDDDDYQADVANGRVKIVEESIGEQQEKDDDNEKEKVQKV
ncbi:predicted protein [Chaetoceros tenuissimus]|uniref:Uncharacterized protein n=1 Tax=Chaetoceros tenuissimus TaxID=426638 RepID=A0AAD3HB11_9STRA|nr:predicted protein [Chaetoceros tenuissimus]